jgi:3-oxoacyl-[acyl-carrier-protein] synthase-3
VVDETWRPGLDRTAIDWLVPHRANIRIVEATASRLELPLERVIITVQDTAIPQRPRCRWR